MSNHVIHVKSCHSCHHSCLSCCHSCHTCCYSCHSCQVSCSLVIKCVIKGIFNKVGWVGCQKVLSRPSADSFAVGRRQKDVNSYDETILLNLPSLCVQSIGLMVAVLEPEWQEHKLANKLVKKLIRSNVLCFDPFRHMVATLKVPKRRVARSISQSLDVGVVDG
jgi:hypothetical protein